VASTVAAGVMGALCLAGVVINTGSSVSYFSFSGCFFFLFVLIFFCRRPVVLIHRHVGTGVSATMIFVDFHISTTVVVVNTGRSKRAAISCVCGGVAV